MNISICIPTFNRPESLDRVLQHLCKFSSRPTEVIIGDNSGNGSAAAVANSYRNQFSSLVYLKRPMNIGVTRNLDSIARIGTAPYIYMLSDDDFVYESALLTMKEILENREDVIAINGGYEGTSRGVIGLDRDFKNSTVSVITKGNYEQLWNNLEITDNHPLMRRTDYVRHARYREVSCAVAPVIFDLLKYGNYIHLNTPVIQHEQRNDSISSRIASHEVTDMSNGDLEVIACKADLLANEGNTVRGKIMRNVYFQGARVLFSSGEYLSGWHSLMRSNAYQGLEQKTKVWIEKNILPKVINEKIIQIAVDTGCTSIFGNSSNIGNSWIATLNMQLRNYPNQIPTDGDNTRSLVLTTTQNVLPQTSAEVIISIPSLVSQFSLSEFEIGVDASEDLLFITSTNRFWIDMDSANEIQILALQTPYA